MPPSTPPTAELIEAPPSGDVAAAIAHAERTTATVTPIDNDADTWPRAMLVEHDQERAVEIVDLEHLRLTPERSHGTAVLHRPASLTEWVRRTIVDTDDVDLYVDADRFTATAVLNPVRAEHPSWGDHRGVLTMRLDPAYRAWRDVDGKALGQQATAEHLQENASTIADPPALDLVEIAETLVLNVGAKVSNAVRLRDGQRSIVFDETVEAVAGIDREVTIPEAITLRVPIFEGTDPAEVPIRLLYRRIDGAVAFAFQIIDRQQRERDVLQGEIEQVADQLGVPVMWGASEPVGGGAS